MSVSYTPQTWIDGAAGGTPLSAVRLSHIESGITGAEDAAHALRAGLARDPSLIVDGPITRNASGAVTSAYVTWPDGTTGVLIADTLSTTFPGAVDAYHVTYGLTTYTQPTVTRDSTGAVTSAPAIIVA